MGKSIFIKSFLRQPLRNAVLILLVGAASFAFVARSVEYTVVSEEINRIELFYRSIGVIAPLPGQAGTPQNFSRDHNVLGAASVVEQSPLVAVSDRRIFTMGILDGIINTTTSWRQHMFTPALEGLDILAVEAYFHGTLRREPLIVRHGGGCFVFVSVNLNYLLAGDPNVLFTEPREFVFRISPTISRTYVIEPIVDLFLPIAPGDVNPLENLVVGREYLFRASLGSQPGPLQGWQTVQQRWYLRSLAGNDGIQYYNTMSPWHWRSVRVNQALADENLVFYLSVDNYTQSELWPEIYANINMLQANLHGVMVVGTHDMTAMPRTQPQPQIQLMQGRLLNYHDHVNSNPVAVICQRIAARHNLSIGDSLTVNLKDLPVPDWIHALTPAQRAGSALPWMPGSEGWWNSVAAPWWATIEASDRYWQSHPTHELNLEIVGTYMARPLPGDPVNNFSSMEVFVPASLIPAGFGWEEYLLSGMYSFVLRDPRYEEQFIAENREKLHQMGFAAVFLPTNFENFRLTVDPIYFSLRVNLAAITTVSVLILALTAFLYLRQNRRNFAIARAMGLPSKKVLQGLFIPLICTWLPSILLGGALAYFFARNQAGETFGAYLGDYETFISLSPAWLGILVLGLAVTAFGCVFIGVLIPSLRPALVLLQGGSIAKLAKTSYVSGETVKMNLGTLSPVTVKQDSRGKKAVLGHSVRFMFRHILRAPVKTALALGLAALFVLSLGWISRTIDFSESEIERLFRTTIITAEIVRDIDHEDVSAAENTISPETISAVMIEDFISGAYLESSWLANFIVPNSPGGGFYFDYSPFGNASGIISQMNQFGDMIYAVNNLEELAADNTREALDDQLGVSGSDLIIEYAPGFGPDDFYFLDGRIPVIISRSTLQAGNFSLGDTAYTVMHMGGARIQDTVYGPVRIIGVFDGGLSRGIGRFGLERSIVLMHLDALDSLIGKYTAQGTQRVRYPSGRLPTLYMTARLSLNPERNRELFEFEYLAQTPLRRNQVHSGGGGIVPLRMIVDDRELAGAITPLEQTIALLQSLYPVIIITSFALAAGLSFLLALQDIKNVAVMRVLGWRGRKAWLNSFCLQMTKCLIGLLLGSVVLLIIGTEFAVFLPPSGLYFAGALIGSAVGALVISVRTPMQLLQTRE